MTPCLRDASYMGESVEIKFVATSCNLNFTQHVLCTFRHHRHSNYHNCKSKGMNMASCWQCSQAVTLPADSDRLTCQQAKEVHCNMCMQAWKKQIKCYLIHELDCPLTRLYEWLSKKQPLSCYIHAWLNPGLWSVPWIPVITIDLEAFQVLLLD